MVESRNFSGRNQWVRNQRVTRRPRYITGYAVETRVHCVSLRLCSYFASSNQRPNRGCVQVLFHWECRGLVEYSFGSLVSVTLTFLLQRSSPHWDTKTSSHWLQ